MIVRARADAVRGRWLALLAAVGALVVMAAGPPAIAADGSPMPATALVAATCSVGQSGAADPTSSVGLAAVRTTIGVAKSMGVPVKGQIVAVMVMFQESSIRNLANDGSSVQNATWSSPGRAYWMAVTKLSLKYPHDRFGSLDGAHDTDSIGLYQQRPSSGWGNYGNSTGTTDPEGAVQRLLDPRWEAMAFFGGAQSAAPTSGLLDVAGWADMAPTVAADAVQQSGFPGLYAQWEAPATTYVNGNQNAPAISLPWYPGGGGGALACTSIPVDPASGEAGHNPIGHLDAASIAGNYINASGWSFDPDAVNGVVSIQISDTGPSGSTESVTGLANLPRNDVAMAYNIIGQFGFAVQLPVVGNGRHTVCAAAVNIGRGTGNSQLGCATVDVGPVAACGGDPSNPTPSGVAAVRTDAGTIVFGRGLDDGVWLRSTAAGAGFATIGGRIQFGPAAASWGGNRLDVFVIGTDGGLYHLAGSAQGSWGGWESLGGQLTASPAVLSFAPDSLDVYGRGTDGQLWTIGWTGSGWTPWTPLGGQLTSGPGAVVDRDSGQATVGVRDTDGALRELRFGSGGPGSFTATGIPVCSAPAYAARTGDGDARTSALRAKDGSLSVGGTPIGGFATSAPALVAEPTNREFSAFTRGTDNALWVYRGVPGAGSWSSLGGQLR